MSTNRPLVTPISPVPTRLVNNRPRAIPASEWPLHLIFECCTPEPNSGCWLWLGVVNDKGYGTRGSTLMHRRAYEVGRGGISPGLLVCHRCDVPSCCNPDHLFLGTVQDNNSDMVRKGRNRTRAQLTKDQVIEMRALWRDGLTTKDLSRRFSVARCTVSSIVRGHKWPRLPGASVFDGRTRDGSRRASGRREGKAG